MMEWRRVSRPAGVATATLWAFLVALSLYKMRAYALDGRFWAEEGRDFFAELAGRDGWGVFGHLYNHHLELATNLVVGLATRVDLARAPLVTTWLSWLLQLLPPALVIGARSRLGLTWSRTFLFVLASAALPQSAEVWANSANLHFHFALLAGVVAALPPFVGRRAWLDRGLLLAAGLSGIPANALLPVFIWRARREKSRERTAQAAVLAGTAALQFLLLASNGFDLQGRDATTPPVLLWMALLAQHVVSPLLGTRLAGHVIGRCDVFHGGGAGAWLLALALSAGCVAFVAWLVRRRPALGGTSLTAATLLAVFCVLTSLGNREVLISTEVGGRYFYAPNLLLVLAVLQAAPPVRGWGRRGLGWRVGVLMWILFALPGLKVYLGGPAWPRALAEAQANQAAQVAIWPPGWNLRLPAGHPLLK